MREPYYITTPIYYVNDRPHIGHCYTTLLADVAARFGRLLRGGSADVFFLTGTDEHAEKVVAAARERGLAPQEWADRNARAFRDAFAAINLRYDDFVRTSEVRHKSRAAAYIQRLVDSGDIELGEYVGWYDPSQEEYLTETTAREHDYHSPVTGRPLEKRTEQNYFFRLDKHEGWLRGEIEGGRIQILPDARRNEVLSRISQGLQKVPVSRRVKPGDADWGILMPGDPEHRVYVWIEALCNYLTTVDTPERRRFWPATVHVMAKDILWFHAVIWPCMLHAMGEAPPKAVYAHSYWIREGRKMSKSLGNFIEIELLDKYAQRYGVDALRWYLATQGPLGATDADFTHGGFVETYNAELANGIGNGVSRVANMIARYFDGVVPEAPHIDVLANANWPEILGSHAERAVRRLGHFDLHGALSQGLAIGRAVDGYINDTEPFRLAKVLEGPPIFDNLSNRDALATILYHCAEALRIASLFFYPACPRTIARMWRQWNCSPLRDPEDENSDFTAPLEELAQWRGPHALRPGQRIEKGDALFMRADPAEAAPQ